MTKLKKLKEKRALIIQAMQDHNEKREFEQFKIKDKELTDVDGEIVAEERMIELGQAQNDDGNKDENREEDNMLEKEIRSVISGQVGTEIDLSEIEVRNITFNVVAEGNTTTKNIAKMTFSEYIVKKLPSVSRLYSFMRKEVLSAASHAIPVQKKKLGKFVKMKELQDYAKDSADYSQVKLEANKYGTLVVISVECAEDTGYDIVGDVKEQILDSYAETIDELIVVGDEQEGMEGLNSFSKDKGAKEIVQEVSGSITVDEIESIYYALPKKYRKSAVWVFSDDTARQINKLKDATGRPLLKEGYNGEPFGENSTLLGKPVVVNDSVSNLDAKSGEKGIFFGDLQRSIVIGPRKSLTLEKSKEFGWINDSIAMKANVRLDIKKTLEEAMAFYTLKGATMSAAEKKRLAAEQKALEEAKKEADSQE